jgi:hypothetical protein
VLGWPSFSSFFAGTTAPTLNTSQRPHIYTHAPFTYLAEQATSPEVQGIQVARTESIHVLLSFRCLRC